MLELYTVLMLSCGAFIGWVGTMYAFGVGAFEGRTDQRRGRRPP